LSGLVFLQGYSVDEWMRLMVSEIRVMLDETVRLHDEAELLLEKIHGMRVAEEEECRRELEK
jgi:hypothetical protein